MTANNQPTIEPTAISQDPLNVNFLSPLNWKFFLKRAPTTNFFLQRLNLPGVSLPPIVQPTPLADLFQPGDHLSYLPLTVTYRVDENLANYFEIYNWISDLGLPDDFADYRKLSSHPDWTGEGLRSEIILSLLDSSRTPTYHFYFHECFPTGISDMTFDVTPQTIDYQLVSVNFRYSTWDYEKI